MSKKKNIIALALSTSFIIGGASLSHADEIDNKNVDLNNKETISKEDLDIPKIEEISNNNNVSNDNSTNDVTNDSLEISEKVPKESVKASVEKEEVDVTDETKTPDESNKVGEVDETVINKSNEFVGKENGQTSLSGDKDIASKKDLDEKKTVDEFNEKTRAEKEAEYKAEIEKSKQKIADNQKEANAYRNNRVSEIVEDIKQDFQKDLDELNKYDGWMLRFSNIDEHTNDKQIYFKASNNFNESEYDKTETYKSWGGSNYVTDYRFTNRENYKRINKEVFPSATHWEKDAYGFKSKVDFKVNSVIFDFAYTDSDTSDEFKDYIKRSNLIERLNSKFSTIYNNDYAKDRKYVQDKEDIHVKLYEEKSDLEDKLRFNKNKFYAKITEDNLRSNKVEIIKDPTIWEGSFRWERYSKNGYIKTLFQNGKEIAKRVVHPLVGIKRVGTKTKEVRERRETESSTYDVIEKPTTNPDENGKVIQEGSDGLVEKVYDATYDKFSNVIKKDLKDTIVKKEKKDRIVLRYGIKEETKTPVTLYDGIKNYDTDEKKIKDYSEKERYRTTDLQRGNVNQDLYKNDEKKEKDGFKFELKNPSETSPNKTEYGYQITIDKKTGQRTYTNIYVGDVGLIPVPTGEKPMMNEGDKLTSESPKVNFKPNESGEVTAGGRQRNLNYVASEDTLKHINNKDNPSTSFGMKDNYTQDNPGIKFFKENFVLGYWVNPWPNENDKLAPLKLSGTYDKKEYVKGQLIKTDIKINNLDDNAKERLVGQVYNPVTGEVVKEADAYIGDDGYVYIKMPDGVINKDGSENKDSIFNKPEYKGLQNLDVKFFARPRTKAEFKKIAETPDENGDTGIYTDTGAGSKFINHKGKEVEVDLQGIDRYDHYNLIGSFKLQLDDTRYYDQNFIGSDKKDTSEHTSIPILPGQEFNIKAYLPEEKKGNPYQKSDLNIKDDETKTNLIGKIDKKFVENYNKDKKEVDRWIIKDDDITKFTIIPPKTAKAGDFMAIPIEYTYTNGSKDVHWFHFVVQGTNNNVPSYQTKIGYQGNTLVSDTHINKDENKNNPISYEFVNDQHIDNNGNVWSDLKIDPKTGQITAVVPKNAKINGGEILTVDVKVNYKDEFGIEKDEIVKAEFVARPKYDGKFSYEEVHEIPFETKVEIDKNLKDGEIKVVQEGELGKKSREITQTYENDKLSDQVVGDFKIIKNPKDRIVKVGVRPKDATRLEVDVKHETHYKYTDEFLLGETKTIKEGKNGKIIYETKVDDNGKLVTNEVEKIDPIDGEVLIGTKKVKNIELPFNTEYIFDETLKAGEFKEEKAGKVGNLKITSGYKDNWYEDEERVEPINRIVRIGGKTNGEHSYTEEIPFKYIIKEDPNLKKGEWVEDIKGVVGGKTTTWTIENSKIVDTKTDKKDPVNAVIRVGKGDLNGEKTIEDYDNISFKTKLIFDDSLKAEEEVVVNEGKLGKKKRNVNLTIVNGKVTDTKYGDFETIEESEDRVIKVGSMTDGKHSHPEKIPFETKVIVNPELKKGEWRYKKEGVLGEKTTTWTIKNSKIVDTKEDVKDPIDAIIEVGSGDFEGDIKHKVVEEKAFDVEIVENPNMVAGTSNIKQKGVKGEVVTEYSQKIKNGQAVGEMTSKEISNKAAIKQIIEVGTKPANNDKDISNETKVKIEYIYDKNLDKGIVKTGDLIKGKVTTKVINEYDPKTGEIKTVEKTIVEDAVQKIIVGAKDYTGEFKHVETQKTEYDTEIVFDNSLKAGETKITQKGELGEKTREITQSFTNGKLEEKKVSEYIETKKPVKQIIKVGSMTEGEHSHTEKIPFKYNISYDSNLKSGEYAIDVAGKEGEKTTVWNIKNSKVSDIKSKTTAEPIDAIIRVGNKDYVGEFKHTEKFKIPYDVEIRTNPDLASGQYKTIQEGKEGSYSVDYLQKIKNGQVDGKLNKTERDRIDVKNHIIEIGTKPAENNKDYSKDVNVVIEYVFDNTKEKGYFKTGELTKGKVETKIINKYNPETGKIETTEKEVVTEAKQKVIIGTKDYTGSYEYEHKEKIPFEVEVREDPTLKKGEKKILQKGEVGEKYYKYSQNIENGKPIGDKKLLEEKLIKDKVNEIILIGTGENTGELEKKIKREIPFETHVIYDENMESGTSKVEKEGKLGEEEVIIKTKIKDGNGESFEEVKKISDKEDRIIRIGIKPIIKEVETSYNTIYKHNKDLKDGELKTIKEGQNGKVITKIFYNKETGKLETIDEVIEKTDKIVEYGSKTNGELKFRSDIAFNVKVIKDENLDSGKIIVDREGKVGIKETKVTIENSKEVNREETIIENSVDKIVRIGTKCDNICPLLPKDPKDPKPEKPEEPKPEKPSDEKPEDPKNPKDPEPEKTKDEIPNKPADPKPDVPKEPKPEEPIVPDEPENPKEPKDVDEEKPSDDKPEEPKEEKPITPKEIEDEKIEKIEENLIEDKKLVKDSIISTNVQTGVSGAEPFIVSALLSSIGLAFTKKKKED